MRNLSDLRQAGSLKSFEEAHAVIADRQARKLPDTVVDLKTATITESMHIHVPSLGILEPNDWALQQIGSSLGVKWKKWFGIGCGDTPIITHKEVQEELSRRFNRLPDMSRLVRSRRHGTVSARSDGVLEAFLNPGYYAIDDAHIFQRLAMRFGAQMSELEILSLPHRQIQGPWGWGWGNDRTTHLSFIFREEHNLGTEEEPDIFLTGFHLRNSEVGASAFTMDDFCLRLRGMLCTLARVGGEPLLYRQHRRIEDTGLDELIDNALRQLPERSARLLTALRTSQQQQVEDPQFFVADYLKKSSVSERLIEKVQVAWEVEDRFSRFALVQAICRAAADMPDPDSRHDMEHLAGRFLLVKAD